MINVLLNFLNTKKRRFFHFKKIHTLFSEYYGWSHETGWHGEKDFFLHYHHFHIIAFNIETLDCIQKYQFPKYTHFVHIWKLLLESWKRKWELLGSGFINFPDQILNATLFFSCISLHPFLVAFFLLLFFHSRWLEKDQKINFFWCILQ